MTSDAPLPLVAEFAVRLSLGLATFVVFTPWPKVPPKFFQTHCQVILGLLVLATLDLGRVDGSKTELGMVIGAASLAYFASVSWGLGIPRVGVFLATLIVACLVGLTCLPILTDPGILPTFLATGRLSSAMLMGSTLAAMLLGHYYLAAPAMSISPLMGLVRWMVASLTFRIFLSALGLYLWTHRPSTGGSAEPLFLAMRWGMGLAGPILATTLAWKTVEIRSTQSATGILYIAMTLVLFGEVSALILSRSVAWLV